MKQLIAAVLFGLVFCTPMVMSQTSGFSQQGKVTHELRDGGFAIAHSSLPLNSKAKIVNTSTGKEVEVTVTRLIPASSNRIADVSSSVWEELGLTPDTDARLYTIVSPRPQPVASQAAVPQTTVSPAAKTAQTGTAQTGTAQTGTTQAGTTQTGTAQAGTASNSLGNLPAGIKFENNNNFIINGNPMAPSAVSSETLTQQSAQPAVSYARPQPIQPSVNYQQPAQPAVSYARPQQTQPAVTYYETPRSRPAQPSVANDMWAQIIKPAAPRTQQTQPAVTYTQPIDSTRPAQPGVIYHDTRPQQALPAAPYTTWTQPVPPVAPYTTWSQPAQPAMTSETSSGQPIVRIVNWPTYQQSYGTQAAQQPYEIRIQQATAIPEKPLPEIQTNRLNEIVTPSSRTFVYIDASPETPVPSVTIDNGPQSYRSVLQEQGRDRN